MWKALILTMLAGAAQACPSYDFAARENYHIAGPWMAEPMGFYVVAGGRFDINACPDVQPITDRGPGFVEDAPDFSFQLREMRGRRLTIRVQSECDAVLLVNTGAGSWIYDNDDNPESAADPQIVLPRAADGRYDVWVGVTERAACGARLTLQAR